MIANAPNPSATSTEDRRARHVRRQARRRRERLLDTVWLLLILVTAAVLGLSLFAHQQKLARVTQELAEAKAQRASTAEPAPALVRAALKTPSGPAPAAISYPIPGIAEAASEAGACPRASASQLAFKRQFLAPIHYWSQSELKDIRSQRVAYPFSGPDVATAVSLFGSTDHLILVADQWVEHVDDAQSSPARIQAECKTLTHYSRFGYFRTHDLEGLGGTRPRFLHLLLHNILLADLSIDGAEYLAIDATGQAQPTRVEAGRKAAGVRFHVKRRDGSPARIDYLRVDLSNAHLQRSANELAFLRQSFSDVVLLKSASHLLQEPNFSITAGVIADHAKSVVQDETGMHIAALQRHFDLRLYGDFADAHRLWSGKAAARELRAFRASVGEAEPLFFTFGYEKPMGSLILVGTRRKDGVKVAQTP